MTIKEVVGIQLGDRSRDGASKLWQSLPGVYPGQTRTQADSVIVLQKSRKSY